MSLFDSQLTNLQISDYFESKTLELQQKMPQKPVSSLSSGEMEAFMEFVLIVERSYYKVI